MSKIDCCEYYNSDFICIAKEASSINSHICYVTVYKWQYIDGKINILQRISVL